MEKNQNDKMLEVITSLLLRVTAIERVLQSEGLITRDRYIKEIKSCTQDMRLEQDKILNSKTLS